MKKFFVFVLLVLLAIVLAGLYGAIHNQISYTVSPEYFTKFKFRQFGIEGMNLPDRARASIVGFLASWWMGIPIGLLVGGFGFIHSSHWRMFRITLLSFAVVIAFTLLFGLCGLFYGWWKTRNINLANYQGWFIPKDVIDLRHFLCAGYMHNSSYLGGTLAIFVAAVFHVVVRIRMRKEIS
jgi:MFS family permease